VIGYSVSPTGRSVDGKLSSRWSATLAAASGGCEEAQDFATLSFSIPALSYLEIRTHGARSGDGLGLVLADLQIIRALLMVISTFRARYRPYLDIGSTLV
jgi:hypothetical protein